MLQSNENEKILKYLELSDEIKNVWRIESVTIPQFLLSITVIMPKYLQKNLETINTRNKWSTCSRKPLY